MLQRLLILLKFPLHEKCPDTEFLWSVFFCIRTEYGDLRSNSVFSPNTGKYGPEKTSYLNTFYAVFVSFGATLDDPNHPLNL